MAHYRLGIIDILNIFRNFAVEMKENFLYDKKSLRAIHGPKANFKDKNKLSDLLLR